MRVYLDPIGLHSRAMTRVAHALARHAPAPVQVVDRMTEADLVVFHLIDWPGNDLYDMADGRAYSIIQYCLKSTRRPDPADWSSLWSNAASVWSYYDLSSYGDFNFYHAPLGIDDVFVPLLEPSLERDSFVTTGYVNGVGAEAIGDAWTAGLRSGLRGLHVGPCHVVGLENPDGWRSSEGVTDQQLAKIYHAAKWVVALRYNEGFELPAAEGLACGARPILFDQPTLRHWYGPHAAYVPECQGEDLVNRICEIMADPWPGPDRVERDAIMCQFSWTRIATGFWDNLLKGAGRG